MTLQIRHGNFFDFFCSFRDGTFEMRRGNCIEHNDVNED